MSVKRPPPPKPARPGKVKVVRATFRYDAQNSDELSFEEDDVLYIIDMSESGWWKAKCEGRVGLIPSNYVEEHTSSIDNPLHDAAKRGNMDFLTDCLNNQVSVNGLDKAGSTPLHWAAHGGYIEAVQALLAVPGCELNVQNKLGDTALHSAAWKGHEAVVRILLEKGANPNLVNNERKTPFQLTKHAGTAALLRNVAGGASVSSAVGYEDSDDDED